MKTDIHPHDQMTLFQKIVAREIPAKIISEDDELIVFHDINPQAPIHVLLVPKKPIPRLAEATAEDGILLGKLLLKAQETAKALGISQTGFRVVINSGRARRRDGPPFARSSPWRTPAHLATRVEIVSALSPRALACKKVCPTNVV